jgi:hypothetical protein
MKHFAFMTTTLAIAVCCAVNAMDITAIDANFKQEEFDGRAIRFGDVRKAPFVVTGFPFRTSEDAPLLRLPADMTEADVNNGALQLARCHTGGAVLFRTNSPFIAIRASAPTMRDMFHMPSTGVSGYDLYERGYNGGERFISNSIPNGGTVLSKGWIRNTMCDYILYLPLYAGTDTLEIGVAPDAKFEEPTPQKLQKPIVFYGSSITQGGCASRPANNYTTMICRALDAPQVNLGFSGSGRGEPAVARAIAQIDASVFVFDYDHNAPTAEHLRQTHEPFFKIIREAHPDLPVIFLSRPHPNHGGERMEIIRQTYENAVAAGDKNVYFIPGDIMFGPDGLNYCTVDGRHPNDLGFYRMFQTILPVVKQALHMD